MKEPPHTTRGGRGFLLSGLNAVSTPFQLSFDALGGCLVETRQKPSDRLSDQTT